MKTSILTKAAYRINAISIKTPIAVTKIQINNIKICMEPQKTQNGQRNPEKEQSWRYQNIVAKAKET